MAWLITALFFVPKAQFSQSALAASFFSLLQGYASGRSASCPTPPFKSVNCYYKVGRNLTSEVKNVRIYFVGREKWKTLLPNR